ncbi:MAG: helicase associated domain-containing protein [Candidatus Acidiferrales bacterium]
MPRSRIKRWNTAYAALKDYRKEHPGEWPLWSYVAPDGLRLGMWCQNQRGFRKRGALARERVLRLVAIGFPWKAARRTATWERVLGVLRQYRRTHPDGWPAEKDIANRVQLQKWCRRQREQHKKGLLSRDRAKRLESIGFEWQPYDAAWEKGFRTLKLYRDRHPDRWLVDNYATQSPLDFSKAEVLSVVDELISRLSVTAQ